MTNVNDLAQVYELQDKPETEALYKKNKEMRSVRLGEEHPVSLKS